MSDVAGLDPRTPVLVGGGQAIDRLGAADYAQLSAVGLAARAAHAALADTGTDPLALAAAVDTIAGVRQFETTSPFARAPLGRADNYPRAVAARIGADPGRAILEVSGGQAPQHLVTELAGSIASGAAEVALIVGSDAISTARHFADADRRPDFAETVGGSLEDRGYGLAGIGSRHLAANGLTDAPSQYALLENARRAREGLSREQYAAEMGALFAPFTKVAAANPFAASPVERDAVALVTLTPANRLIADPYPRYLVARDQVNQGAAVLLMSIAAARRLGVPEERWVFLAGYADAQERRLLTRPDLSRSPAAARAFDAYFADPDLWVAILTGAGAHFCAGHDLAYAASGQKVWVPLNGLAGLTSRVRLPKPVIAAVNGPATGGGCEIALACHLVVADPTAEFALSGVRAGLAADAGGLVRLPRAIPEKIATEMVVTGRRMSAAEAHRWGLVNRVTGAGAALAGARELAAGIMAGSPTVVRTSLQIMADAAGIAGTVAAVTGTAEALEDLMMTADAAEAVKALAERRAPRWRNQ
jgi:enoyl-CoA hydratase/carnithine racemase